MERFRAQEKRTDDVLALEVGDIRVYEEADPP